MTKDLEVNAKCKACGAELPANHTGPCPSCGKEGKRIFIRVKDIIRMSDSVSLSWERRREYLEENPTVKWILRIILVGSPLVGLILSGWIGLAIGFILGLLSHLLGPMAATKVREIERGRS